MRLVGVVIAEGGDQPVLGWSVLTVGDAPGKRLMFRRDFAVQPADGSRVRVRVDAAEARVVGERTVRGAWREVEADPLAAPFREEAPGPHVAVTLRGVIVAPGDPIAIEGREGEVGFVDGTGGPREAPEQRMLSIGADVVAVGAEAQAVALLDADAAAREEAARKASEQERRAQRRLVGRRPWHMAWGYFIPLAIGAGGGVLWLRGGAARVALLWMVLFAGVSLFWRTVWLFPDFGGTPAKDSKAWSVGWSVLTLFAAVGFLLPYTERALRTPLAVGIHFALVFTWMGLTAWDRERRTMRLLRALLDAPAHPPDARTVVWGTVEGIARDDTPATLDGKQVVIGTILRTTHLSGETPSETERKTATKGTFFVKTADAQRVDVDPEGGLWASTVRHATFTPKTERTAAVTIWREVIPLGASVLAGGRLRTIDDKPRLVAAGKESLLIFATDAPAGARAVALGCLVRQQVLLGVYGVGCAIALAIALL